MEHVAAGTVGECDRHVIVATLEERDEDEGAIMIRMPRKVLDEILTGERDVSISGYRLDDVAGMKWKMVPDPERKRDGYYAIYYPEPKEP